MVSTCCTSPVYTSISVNTFNKEIIVASAVVCWLKYGRTADYFVIPTFGYVLIYTIKRGNFKARIKLDS